MNSCEEVHDEFMQTSSTFFGGDEVVPTHTERKDLSDEAQELNLALVAAQRALEAARYFVNSPSLSRASSAKGNEREVKPEGVEASASRSSSEVRRSERQKAKPSEAVKQAKESGQRKHMSMGEAAARARVRRAKSMEVAERLRSEAEAEANAAEKAEAAAAVVAHRRRAARRAASEQRARRCALKQDEELQTLLALRREEQRSMGLRYAKSAGRRVESERVRREDLAREVLAGLHAEQAARREAGLRKGHELQQRCQDADFAHCKPIVESRRHRPKSLPPDSLRLPPIV